MKELLRENDVPKKIKHIKFGVLTSAEMNEMAELEVVNRELYRNKMPVRFGALDRRLGISDKISTCETCGLKLAECSGHFGVLNLELPVFHVGYFKATIQTLNCICKICSRVLLSEEDRQSYLRRLRIPALEGLQKAVIVKTIYEQCRKQNTCFYCKRRNGLVKKVAALKIIHEINSPKAKTPDYRTYRPFSAAIEAYPDIKANMTRIQEDLNPIRVRELFEAISADDCELMGFDSDVGRPEDYIWSAIPVPPACIRPSVGQENGTNEDDITVKLTEIIYTNSIIKANLAGSVPFHTIMEDWDFLQLQCAMYIHSEFAGIPASMQFARSMRGFCQRLKGKQGRFRGNLSGKRVDFSGRTVISPDPNLRINEVGVPIYIAKTLTYPEIVTDFNVERMRRYVENGPDVHPGANYIQSGAIKKFLKFGDRRRAAKDLKVGDVIERHLIDGDAVLFNRQPSLHKLSIMCHFARVRPWRTLRFNECACAPYNADFDGDEMNIHLPQTEEARSEAIELMGIKYNLVTPRNGQPLISATQDFITAAYLLSSKEVFVDRVEFCRLVSYMADAAIHIDLPPPTIVRPMRLWTGKQVFNVLLRPSRAVPIALNLETKGRTFVKVAGRAPELCPNEGYVIVRNSELLCGVLDKSIVGGDSKGSIFYALLRDYGPDISITCMTRIAKLAARWLGTRGFSIGINDVQPGARLRELKNGLIEAGYAECDRLIDDFRRGLLQTQPGCTADQTLEGSISGILSRIRDDCGSICIQELSKHNSPLIMQWCGSKGSKINVSQMVACVGQQIISGSRIADGFVDRTLPHFPVKSRSPAAKGFVQNSFYSGLTPTEFFFHACSGREGLIDTAVKTAETGYMQRRLMKALEDLSTQYDYSVRNSVGGVVQFCYGDDGLDPTYMEGDNQPVVFARNLMHAKGVQLAAYRHETPMTPVELQAYFSERLQADFEPVASSVFVKALSDFVAASIILPVSHATQKYAASSASCVENLSKITFSQFKYFLDLCLEKYHKARIEPGTAVGAIGAQSIGEPGTQMTLKTFHFAGVASMNVTLGVPRIKEIINASKVISTPIITAKLVNEKNATVARIVKGRIEVTKLGDICSAIDEIHSSTDSYLSLNIDLAAIAALQLEIDLYAIQRAILKSPKLKIAESQLFVQQPNRICIRLLEVQKVSSSVNDTIYGISQKLKRMLPHVYIKGIPTIGRAVINNIGNGKHNLLVEGYGLLQVMTTDGIDGRDTTSNHIMEMQKVLGIEAARHTIAYEIQYTMGKHGMTIDSRHVMLLADLMTFKGEVLGITRFGISKMKDSVLMLASFEKTTDHLFDASLFGKKDEINGVSECIIMGIPMPVGTGMFKLLHKTQSSSSLCFEKETVFWSSC